jgi:hypothetical protein
MSSEESCIEGDIEMIYRVKILAWRRDIEEELTIIDRQQVLDVGCTQAPELNPTQIYS